MLEVSDCIRKYFWFLSGHKSIFWSDQPKYCFKYTTLCQSCISIWLLVALHFEFGWLRFQPDPTFNQTGSSFTALQSKFSLLVYHSLSKTIFKTAELPSLVWCRFFLFLSYLFLTSPCPHSRVYLQYRTIVQINSQTRRLNSSQFSWLLVV